jgi:hypothetical protein
MMTRLMINVTVFVVLMLALQYSGEMVNTIFMFIAQFLTLNIAANFITNTIIKE